MKISNQFVLLSRHLKYITSRTRYSCRGEG